MRRGSSVAGGRCCTCWQASRGPSSRGCQLPHCSEEGLIARATARDLGIGRAGRRWGRGARAEFRTHNTYGCRQRPPTCWLLSDQISCSLNFFIVSTKTFSYEYLIFYSVFEGRAQQPLLVRATGEAHRTHLGCHLRQRSQNCSSPLKSQVSDPCSDPSSIRMMPYKLYC